MEELPEKRKLDQNMTDPLNGEKRQATDENRAISLLNRTDEEIFNGVSQTTVSMSCPPEKVGPLIGKKGVVVQEIMKKSQCRIYVDQNFPEGHPRQIQLTGHPKDLAIAIALVILVMEHGPSIISPGHIPVKEQQPSSASTDSNDVSDSEFQCPPSKVGALIGPKGSNVHEIFRRTGCRVQVLQDGVPEGVDRRVAFTGTAQQIADAKALVLTLINGGTLEPTPGASNEGAMPPAGVPAYGARIQESDIDPDKVRLVIGAKGVTIGEIMKRSGCKIFVNQNFPEGQMHKVVYTGSPQQIDVAKYLVDIVVNSGMSALYSVLNGTDNIVIQEMNIFQSQALRLTTNDAVNEIQNRFSVKINVDSPTVNPVGAVYGEANTTRLSIIGKIDNVQSAIKLIYQHTGAIAPSSALASSNLALGSDAMDISSHHFGSATTPSPAPSSSPILALGKDGTSGHLESAVGLPDGTQQQVAEIKNDIMGRVVGAKSANIALIKAKSGANVQVLKSDNMKGTTRVVLSGSPQSVSLAAQMVQEVLVNGPAKLLKMSDAVSNAAGPKSGIPGHVVSHGHQSMISAAPQYYGQGNLMYPAVALANQGNNFAQYPGVKRY